MGGVFVALACWLASLAFGRLTTSMNAAGPILWALAMLMGGAGAGVLIGEPLRNPPATHEPFRFSLKLLFVTTTVFAIGLWALVALGERRPPAMSLTLLELFGASMGAVVGIPTKRPVFYGTLGAAAVVPAAFYLTTFLH